MLFMFAMWVLVAVSSVASAKDATCSEPASAKSTALLQRAGFSRIEAKSSGGGRFSTNPSGAAAPLNEEGYNAVADRCCQAEMKVFVERVIHQNNLQICHSSGFEGFIPWHSCGAVNRSFAKLNADLLEDAQGPCPWVQNMPGECQPLPGPPACLSFPGILPASPCQCSRSDAAKVDFAAITVTQNNLGGEGPDSGVEELRLGGSPSAGVSSTGEPFDVVVTIVEGGYELVPNRINGIFEQGGVPTDFGVIWFKSDSAAGGKGSFKFSFVQPGTNVPVTLSEVHLSAFDLDGDTNPEFTSSRGYKGFATVPNTNLVATKLPDGRTEFRGTVQNQVPSSSNTLTDAQMEGSVMFFYNNVDSFELEYGRFNKGSGGLLFSFGSSLDELCDE